MIVPAPRLLFWTGIILLPCAALAGVLPETLPAAAALVIALAGAALADALAGARALDGVGVELPPIIRLARDRQGAIAFQLRDPTRRGRRLRLALSLPAGIDSPYDDLVADLPVGSESARLSWTCTGRRRGRYQLDGCAIEAASPLGLWTVRRTLPARAELRVYPNLLAEGRRVAAIFLHRGAFGIHAQRRVGKGREFEKLRDYIPGDGFEDVHWRATAKRGRPVTKIFQIERTQEVYVVVDTARLSARSSGTPPQPALERFINAALVLALAAEQQGDLFGAVAFADDVRAFVRARTGREHFNACRDALYALHSRPVTPDFQELASFLRLRLRRRALLLFLTDLDDPVLAEGFVRSMDLLRRQHLILVSMLRPAAARPLFSDAAVTAPDDLYRHLAGHLQWHDLRELSRVLRSRGVGLSLLESEAASAGLVSKYLEVKQRQLL